MGVFEDGRLDWSSDRSVGLALVGVEAVYEVVCTGLEAKGFCSVAIADGSSVATDSGATVFLGMEAGFLATDRTLDGAFAESDANWCSAGNGSRASSLSDVGRDKVSDVFNGSRCDFANSIDSLADVSWGYMSQGSYDTL